MTREAFRKDPIDAQEALSRYVHLPELQEATFEQYPRATYFIGLVAVGNQVILPEGLRASRALRYATYSKLGWIDDTEYEFDNGLRLEPWTKDDERSEHIVVVRNMRGSAPRVIATVRSIIKQDETPLPVEEHYPEFFEDQPVPLGANEVSRLISDSQDRRERALASSALQRAITARCIREDYGPTFAMIEDYLIKRLQETHFPHDIVEASLKPIPEYANTQNAIMQTDWRRVLKGTRYLISGAPLVTSLFFSNLKKPQSGFGFYDKNFLRQLGSQPESEWQ